MDQILRQLWESSGNYPLVRAAALSLVLFGGITSLISSLSKMGFSDEIESHRWGVLGTTVVFSIVAAIGSLLWSGIWWLALAIFVVAVVWRAAWRSQRFREFVQMTYRRLVTRLQGIVRWVRDNWHLTLALLLLICVAAGVFLIPRALWPLLLIALALTLANAFFAHWLLSISRRPIVSEQQGTSAVPEYGFLLEKIDFDYQDSPTEHGWQIGGSQPSFTHIGDRVFPSVIEIVPSGDYVMDLDVLGDGRIGTRIEFAAKPGVGFTIYVRIDLAYPGGAEEKDSWLTFRDSLAPPEKVGGNEWMIYVKPVQRLGDWGIYQVDLKEAVRETFARTRPGCRHELLKGFRLRHDLSIAYISVFKSWS